VSHHGETVRLSEWCSRSPVVLVFFPLAFTGTCTDELGELRDHASLFEQAGARVLAVSVNDVASVRVFAERERLPFPLLADFWPHGQVADRFGVFLPERGHAARITFVIDRTMVVRSRFGSAPGEARQFASYGAALDTLGEPQPNSPTA